VHRVPIILARPKTPYRRCIRYLPLQRRRLLSYGADRIDTFRRAASYVRSHSTRREAGRSPCGSFRPNLRWFVNLKTAKALGLAVPPSILLRADEVIE